MAKLIRAPAGSDMQILPPTVAVLKILNEADKASAHRLNRKDACQSSGQSKSSSSRMVQVAAISSPCSLRSYGVPVEGHQVDHGIDSGLRLGIEPCASGDIGMARFPGAELFLRIGSQVIFYMGQIHGYSFNVQKQGASSTRRAATQAQTILNGSLRFVFALDNLRGHADRNFLGRFVMDRDPNRPTQFF